MRFDVARDWEWADGFLPEVRRILLQNAIELFDVSIATTTQDLSQATDMVITMRGEKAIAVRIRREDCTFRDLTIRAWRLSGAETELTKIKAGAGDLYLYAWAQGTKLPEWVLVDLDSLRASGLLEDQSIIHNPDARTGFIAIPVSTLRLNDCVIADTVIAA